MQIGKRISSLILSIIFVCACVPAVLAVGDNEWDAVGIFGKTTTFQNMAAATEVVGSVGQAEEKAGRGGWRMTSESWYYNSIFINVKGVRAAVGKNALVEVDYYDEGENGWFCLEYNSRDRSGILTEQVHTTGTNSWKTARFTLYAPTMADDLPASQHSADFAVTTERDGGASVSDITIGAVRVKFLDEVKSADAVIKFTKNPKNYYDNEQVEFDLTIKDVIGKAYTADMKYWVVNSYGETVAVWEDTLAMSPFVSVVKRITPDFNIYGRHTLFVEGRCEELGYYFETHEDFAYIKRSDFWNERFGVCNHFAWNRAGCDPDIIYPMMANAGIKWSRDEIKWADIETRPKEFKIPAFGEYFVDKANEYGIDILMNLLGGNPLYGSPAKDSVTYDFVHSPEWYDAYEEYVYELVKAMGNRVRDYEFWNEYGWGGVDHDKYIDMAKASYNGVKRADANANTIGICSAGTGAAITKTSFAMGAENYMEDVSYHTYPDGAPEVHNVSAEAQSVRDLLDTYETGPDKKIWLTEYGWNNLNYTPNQAGENLAKANAMLFETNLVDKLFWYEFCDGTTDYAGWTFGMVEGFFVNHYNRFLANPAYVAAANFNDLAGTPEYQSKLRLNDERVYAYHYKRSQDGEDVAILWSTQENDIVNMNFGSNDIEFCDYFGNPIELSGADGTYALTLGIAPIYAVGKFEKFEEGKPQIYISETGFAVAEEDVVSVRFYKTTDKAAEIEVSVPEGADNIEILSMPKFTGKAAELKLKVKGHIGDKDNIPLKVTLEDGFVCYDGYILIEYVDAFDISGRARVYDVANKSRWMLDLNIYSNFHRGDIDATLDITYPEVLKKNNVKLGKLKPGENSVSIHLNEIGELSTYEMRGVIKTKDGYSLDVSFPIDFGLGFKADTPPVIDGKLSDGEWIASTKMTTNREEQLDILIDGQHWDGINDLSADSYIQWDEKNLYFAAVVNDDTHFNDKNDGTIWQCDSIQLSFSFNSNARKEQDNSLRTEIGVALGKDNKIIFHSYAKETGINGNFENCEAMVVRSGKKTIYELRCPWTDISPEGTEIYEDMDLRYAMLVNDNDGSGRWGIMQFGGGISPTKDVSKHARVKLMP